MTDIISSEPLAAPPAPQPIRKLADLLCALAFHARTDKLLAMLDAHAAVASALDARCVDARGYSPLHYAAAAGNAPLVAGLCARAPRLVAARDANGDAPLHAATRHGHTASVRVLLENGANPSVANYSGSAALHMAAVNCHLEIMALLLDAGAFVGAKDGEGATALHWAAVAQSLQATASQCDADTNTANAERVASCVSLLIERSANVNACDDENETPLHWSAREAASAALRALLDCGADASAVNAANETALVIAEAARLGAQASDIADELSRASRCAELLSDAQRRVADAKKDKSGANEGSGSPLFRVVL